MKYRETERTDDHIERYRDYRISSHHCACKNDKQGLEGKRDREKRDRHPASQCDEGDERGGITDDP